jgi:hypothetical protein
MQRKRPTQRVNLGSPGTLSITKVAQDGVDITVALDNGGGGGSGSFGGPDSDCAQPPAAQPGSVTL